MVIRNRRRREKGKSRVSFLADQSAILSRFAVQVHIVRTDVRAVHTTGRTERMRICKIYMAKKKKKKLCLGSPVLLSISCEGESNRPMNHT